MNDASDQYQQGRKDATARNRQDLAAVLRTYAVEGGPDNPEVLSDSMVRDIFTGVFGVVATDEEFGPEPSGSGVRGLAGLD